MVKRIAKASLAGKPGQNDAMERIIAVSSDTVGSEHLYSSIVRTAPSGRTQVHHHGECETSIYILSGRARFYSGDALRDVTDAEEGDFIYVPAYEVHVEANLSTTDDLVVLLSRNCAGSVVHYVEGTLPDEGAAVME
jgi:uncharacterized RmlC-like cupin family protein